MPTYTKKLVRELGKNVQSEFAEKLVDQSTGLSFTPDGLANSGDSVAVAADDLTIPTSYRYVAKTTGADAELLTMADGTFKGQRVKIQLVVDGGGTATFTSITSSGFSDVDFADAGDFVDLEWTDDGWIITGAGGLTAQPTITA